MEPLTPNTTAFLSYLSANYPNPKDDNSNANTAPQSFNNNQFQQPKSLPPSAFFNMPIPGRDTPEDTPSSNDSTSPPEKTDAKQLVSDDSDSGIAPEGRRKSDQIGHSKRKVSQGHPGVDPEDDDDEHEELSDDSEDGHEDKRKHGNAKTTKGRKGKGEGKELTKAQRRKEQNRAAQKAFRERREAKVKDLETQVAELENKAYGANVENENLRGILKRLQEENVALKQAAFTFSMPVSSAGSSTPTANNVSNNGSVNRTTTATPPQQDDSLRSINEVQMNSQSNSRQNSGSPCLQPINNQRQGSGSGSGQGQFQAQQPASTMSKPSWKPGYLQDGSLNVFDHQAMGGTICAKAQNSLGTVVSNGKCPIEEAQREKEAQEAAKQAQAKKSPTPPAQWATPASSVPSVPSVRSNSSSQPEPSPLASSSSNRTEIDALWADFLEQQAQQRVKAAQKPNTAPLPLNDAQYTANAANSFLNAANANSVNNNSGQTSWDKMAFRDDSANNENKQTQTLPAENQNQNRSPADVKPTIPQSPNDMWAGMMDSSMQDFLSSLNGNNSFDDTTAQNNAAEDEDFDAQLRKILGNDITPSAAFDFSGNNNMFAGGQTNNPFSPTGYLNMSPSPLASISNAVSPHSASGASGFGSGASNGLNSVSASASPESSNGGGSGSSVTSVSYGSDGNKRMSEAQKTQTEACPDGIVILDKQGNRINPGELWNSMGLNKQDAMHNILIDDLCDLMKANVKTEDGVKYITQENAEYAFVNKFAPERQAAREGVNGQMQTR